MNAARNISMATVSERALIGCALSSGPREIRHQAPRQTLTTASFVGAMFQVGLRFGSVFTVENSRAINSTGRKLAYRPHMVAMW